MAKEDKSDIELLLIKNYNTCNNPKYKVKSYKFVNYCKLAKEDISDTEFSLMQIIITEYFTKNANINTLSLLIIIGPISKINLIFHWSYLNIIIHEILPKI